MSEAYLSVLAGLNRWKGDGVPDKIGMVRCHSAISLELDREVCLAFENLKTAMVEAVVLAHPDFRCPFVLSTHASSDGIGAVLSQVQAGDIRARPIAFTSKSLSP